MPRFQPNGSEKLIMAETDSDAKTTKPKVLMICINRRFRVDEASCAARESPAIAGALEDGVQQRKIDIRVERSVCMGQCQVGPTIRLAPGGRFILGKSMDDVDEILDELERLCGTREDDALPLDLLGS